MAEALVRTIKRYYVRMQTLSCTSYQLGSITTTGFTHTRHSDIVHPVSSSQLTEAHDRVRSFGGYNTYIRSCELSGVVERAHSNVARKTKGWLEHEIHHVAETREA